MTLETFCREHGIKPELRTPNSKVPSIGFSATEQKWYGWSHRAIYGFAIGHTVKSGDCAYTADNPEEMIDDRERFFADISEKCGKERRAECQILPDRSGICILHAPLNIPIASSMEEVLEADYDTLPVVDIAPDFTIEKCGRGKWTAKTLVDAKQMACDFAESVS